jgi:hypothetical protein
MKMKHLKISNESSAQLCAIFGKQLIRNFEMLRMNQQ